ncbi:hypothetical protein [Luteibacter sp. CQ10]|uniref:hypothetical protein n=1 Tax=Luteibacter sp. CQ10 TaxID=2805821 RepID=UPI0034A33980
MTTNAIDKKKIVIASDSRWSAEVDGDHIVFLDDYGFHKIAMKRMSTMVCAGDAILIEGWMEWFGRDELDLENMPALNRRENGELCHVVFHIVTSNGDVFDPGIGGTLDYNDEARFAGTGATHALTCFSTNRCVKTSVATAAGLDPCTGGTTRFVDFGVSQHNLIPFTSGAAELNSDLGQRGTIMNRHTREVSTINEFLSKRNGSAPQTGLGNVSASAPTGTPAFEWSESQKNELKRAFTLVASLEASAKNDQAD